MKFKVLGKEWTIIIQENEDYAIQHGTDSLAITYLNDRIIYLSCAGNDEATIAHELVHAYCTEMCAGSMNGTYRQLEEFFAEFVSKHGKELLDLAKKLAHPNKRKRRRKK
jgi:hypothetical protein